MRRIARWWVVATFWIVVLVYLVPVGVLWLTLQIVGIRVFPADPPPATTQQPWLPFDLPPPGDTY